MSDVADRFKSPLDKNSPLQGPSFKDRSSALADAQFPRRTASTPCPLSFAQERLWFLDQFEPNSAAYNIVKAIRLRGSLNAKALQQALDAIVARHEAIRTTFGSVEGIPVQVIAPEARVDIRTIDLEQERDRAGTDRVQAVLDQEAQRPFDLTKDLMLRAMLLRIGREEHILMLVMHHIASDGWSLGVLLRELEELYRGFCANEPPVLKELPVQYADYAQWQRKRLQGETLETQLNYWKKQLAGLEVLELPTDRPRPPAQTFRGAKERVLLSGELPESIRGLRREERVSLFMILMAAFQALLHRYTGQNDIAVGTPIANRTRVETEGLIGFFANTLVMRADFSADPSFRELVKQVRGAALDAYDHQDVPFEKLVEVLQPERRLSHSPLFQVMFALQNAPSKPLSLPGLSIENLQVENNTAKFDLLLNLRDQGDCFEGSLTYSTDLFDAATIQRMLGHYRTLLEAAVQDPDCKVSRLPILTELERRQLLVEWNDTEQDYPRDCVHQLFEQQAEQTPDAAAVVFENQQLSYRELNRRANRLAHRLRELGVGPNVLVGICVERSLEMVVGLLGILKAGGAYVPLDPSYPKDRLAFMVEDARLGALVTQTPLAELLPRHGTPLVCLDTLPSPEAGTSAGNPAVETKPDDLAYVIYTSGSTGQPKGVQLTHRSLGNLLSAMGREIKLGGEDVVLSVTTLSFDIATLELLLPLISGARIVVVSREIAMDGIRLARELGASGATFMQATPATWEMLVQAGWQYGPLKALSGGEALPRALADRLLERCRYLWNGYGPTETTIYSTLSRVEAGAKEITIGRPVSNTQIYALDRHLEPVPVGVPGELHIGGIGLARGYLNRPELTAEKFIANPFSNDPRARLYKTGDLVRYRPDGNLEYLGRLDHQVKLRGFRIELGEIEAHLADHPAVRRSTVIVREDEPGNRRLVAYVVAEGGQAPQSQDLRGFLRDRLPDYMVPARFVLLEKLPLTPNGKVDRRALPKPEPEEIHSSAETETPQTPMQKILREIWQEVLGVRNVSVQDNFFDLGGHSLLSMKIIARFERQTGFHLSPRQLLSQTLGEIASTCEARSRQAPDVAPSRSGDAAELQRWRSPILPRGIDGPSTLSFAQERLWFLDQFEPQSAFYNIPAALHLRGSLDEEALQQALNALVRRHEALRTTFRSIDGAPLQVVSSTARVKLEIIDWTERDVQVDSEEVRERIRQEARRPFDLARDLMLRAALLRLREGEHVLLLTMHHIASDGWSQEVLSQELSALYDAFRRGAEPSLPPLPIQYADYALWQRQTLRGETLERELEYWKKQLAGLPVLELPTDFPRPPVQSFRGARERLSLSKELSESLRRLCREERVSSFMVLLAAFQALLHRYTGQTDIAVGTPVANRGKTETDGLIGFFVNTLVLRTDLSGDLSFREAVRRARGVVLSAMEHQEVPFEKLVEALQPERSLSHTPLFQVMFVLQNESAKDLKLPEVNVNRLEASTETAKFDLTLYLRERGDQIVGVLNYNTDLFKAATIRRMLGHYRTLLEAVVRDPELTVREAPILTAPEQRQLAEWNETRKEYPRACVHQLFEAQAERIPNVLALVFREERLTYRELNERANRLAHHLRGLGIGRGTLVGIQVERSPELVVGLLAILKAGGAYVPIDPSYPPERVSFLLEDAGIEVLLTQTKLRDKAPSQGVRLVFLDAFFKSSETAAGSDRENLPCELTADSLAYVMYTSGSTGSPKGVEVVHRGIVRLLCGADFAHLGEEEVLLQLATPSFDASTFEIWGALLHGGRCVLFDGDVPTAGDLGHVIKQHRITTLWLTASLFNALIDEAPEVLAPVRQLLVGGEALSVAHIRRALEALPETQLINGYGPTEGTTFTCCYRIPREVEESATSIPIGRPIANTQVYVLDRRLRAVPAGIPGELYIGGDGLARGYLKQPDLTNEKFIPNPFDSRPGARLYRTGDLVRYQEDGNIEFLGRLDDQVKIRGFRIEPGEIEAVLASHPLVREATVLLTRNASGEKRLVAYVTSENPQEISNSQLRGFLEEKLPHYMIPSAFVVLERLPLTASGKVDRQALAELESIPETKKAFVAPRNLVERQLAEVWEGLLGVQRVGATDDFFELGGHSLLALRLFSQIEKAFKKKLPLATLFQASTVEKMAAILAGEAKAPERRSLVPIQPQGSKQPLFCVHAGGAHVLFYRDLALRLGPDQPFYGLQPKDIDERGLSDPRIEKMAADYIQEIRERFPEGPYHLGGSSFGGLVAFEMARQLHAQGHKVGLVALFDTHAPGYPVYLPGTTRFRRRMNLWIRRFQHHWSSVALLEARAKLKYVLTKSAKAGSWLKTGVKSSAHRLVQRLYSVFRPTLPQSLREGKKTMRDLQRQYVPEVYAGRITLFRASRQPLGIYPDPNLGWTGLAAGGLEVYEVPGSHGAIVTEPYVRFLVEKLRPCLETAQSSQSGEQGPRDDSRKSADRPHILKASIGA